MSVTYSEEGTGGFGCSTTKKLYKNHRQITNYNTDYYGKKHFILDYNNNFSPTTSSDLVEALLAATIVVVEEAGENECLIEVVNSLNLFLLLYLLLLPVV